jgi:hypothetical protein
MFDTCSVAAYYDFFCSPLTPQQFDHSWWVKMNLWGFADGTLGVLSVVFPALAAAFASKRVRSVFQPIDIGSVERSDDAGEASEEEANTYRAVGQTTSSRWAAFFALAATIVGGLVAYSGAHENKQRFNAAWIILDTTMKAYSCDSTEVLQARLYGEYIINGDALDRYVPKLKRPELPDVLHVEEPGKACADKP